MDLHEAAEKGNLERIQELVSQQLVNVNSLKEKKGKPHKTVRRSKIGHSNIRSKNGVLDTTIQLCILLVEKDMRKLLTFC